MQAWAWVLVGMGFVDRYSSIFCFHPDTFIFCPQEIKRIPPISKDNKDNGKMSLTFNPTQYASLLAEAIPQVIQTKEEYDRALQLIEPLHFKAHPTPEEDALYDLLLMLIKNYEDKTYPTPTTEPHGILQHIMESSGTRQADLVELGLGSSGVVSELVNGKRAISKAQAKLLSDRFKVSPSLFI
jgi:HTH-type transcriptional regulator / antitoxin HigA